MKKVLLYSGGMDSWLIDKLWKPDIKLFIDVKTPNSVQERKRLPNDVIIKELPIGEFEQKGKNFFLPLRNLFFVEMASYYGDEICLGATGNSTHFDKTEKFAKDSSDIINYLYSENCNKKVKVVLPFRNITKKEMLSMYLKEGGNAEKAWKESFSCYSPTSEGKECGECESCKRKKLAFLENGYNFEF